MQFDERAFLENKAWVDSMLSWDSNYCRLQANHSPEVFWIGCSGPNNCATPHRAICSCIATSAIEDPTFLSALEYAISALGVRYIIVCGHEG